MRRKQKLNLEYELIQLQHPYPKDDLIKDYADFLKIRDYLHLYKFNPRVFNALLDLILENWHSTSRMSRITLLTVLKDYLVTHQEGNKKVQLKLAPETIRNLFILFTKSIDESHVLSPRQVETARMLCNRLILDQPLDQKAVQWLCANADKHNSIVNRILKYPEQNFLITRWVKENFNHDMLRTRRSTSIAWILDEDPEYTVDIWTILQDFAWANAEDQRRIAAYKEEVAHLRALQQELEPILGKEERNYFGEIDRRIFSWSEPELNLTYRPYRVPKSSEFCHFGRIPDFELLEGQYKARLDYHHRNTMLWAISYSHLGTKTRNRLYKKHYHPDVQYAMTKIAIRERNQDMLRWLMRREAGE